ncbi:MAG: GNAT family N-acetyltransferase [candidate division Zixibacteria bacterium]|nr:GNAT family N-acetyltransferase [candidate division Zixibacteria bacterium]
MADKKLKFPTPPDLVGKNIYLRPATHKDVANTYHWFLVSDPATQACRPHPFTTAMEAAEAYQKREPTIDRQLFVIIKKKDSVPVGLIRFFDMNMLNRSTEYGLIIDPDERKKGHALEAIRLLTRYLIKTRDINKVYAQTSGKNKGAVALLEKAGFKRDGTLRHHYFYDGELHDGYIYSLLRFEFDQ